MKKLLLLILPLLAITFNSCSKDDGGDNGGNNSGKLVKKITYEGDCTIDFYYDNQNRINKYIWKGLEQGGGTYTTNIAYSNNKITVTDQGYAEGTIFTLDNNGYVTKCDWGDGDYVTYEYSNGYLSRLGTATYTWENGNPIKELHDDGDEHIYTYGDKVNKLNVNIFLDDINDDEFLVFKGSYIKNLPTSCISTYTGTHTRAETYTYTLDDDGYPTKIITDTGGGINTTTITYY